jgi:HEAT repeat protein
LLEKVQYLDDHTLKQEYFNYLKWTEPLALMLALVEDKDLAMRLVGLALEVDLMLGARLAGEVREEFQAYTINLLRDINALAGSKLKFLGETRSQKAVPLLLSMLKDPKLGDAASYALGKINLKSVTLALLDMLESQPEQDSYLFKNCIRTLGHIGSYEAVSILLVTFEKCDVDAKKMIVETLRSIRSKESIAVLIEILNKDKNSSVRKLAVTGCFSQTPSEKSLNALIHALNDEDKEVGFWAAIVLGRSIKNEITNPIYEDVVKALAKTMRDDSLISAKAAIALGENASPQIVTALLDTFGWEEHQSDDSWFLPTSKEMKLSLNNYIPLEHFPLLNSTIEEVINFIAPDPHGRSLVRAEIFAIRALSRSGSEYALIVLEQALKDSDEEVSNTARKVLSEIELRNEALSQLSPRTAESRVTADAKTCKSAVESLRKIQGKEGIPLAQSIREAGEAGGQLVLEELGLIGNLDIVPELLRLSKKAPHDLEICSEKALIQIIGRAEDGEILDHLPSILPLVSKEPYSNSVRLAIQANCKFYNYEIFHSPPAKPQATKQSPSPGYTIIHAPNAEKIQIFEQVDTYIETNHPKT